MGKPIFQCEWCAVCYVTVFDLWAGGDFTDKVAKFDGTTCGVNALAFLSATKLLAGASVTPGNSGLRRYKSPFAVTGDVFDIAVVNQDQVFIGGSFASCVSVTVGNFAQLVRSGGAITCGTFRATPPLSTEPQCGQRQPRRWLE